METDKFVAFLESLHGQKIFLVSPPGNSGDILLQKGLKLHLEKYNHKLVDSGEVADVILMHGGGSIDDVWRTGRDLLVELLHTYPDKRIVVAPSTFHFFDTDFAALLRPFKQPIYLFCRENYSYQRLLELILPANVTVQVACDTAFLLLGTDYLASLKQRIRSEYNLLAMRTNRESRIISLEWYPHKKNILEWLKHRYIRWEIKSFLRHDFTSVYNQPDTVVADPSYESYDQFVDSIVRAREIYTDRLHVGILGALLGKPVHLLPTKYDKIQGVYEYTLKSYPNVTPHFDT